MSFRPPLRLAANLDWLYGALPLSTRFAAAAEDGFDAVELLRPYEHLPDWYAAALHVHGLQAVLINTPVGESAAGRFGWGAVPGAQAQFRESFEQARAVAEATGCRCIHVMAGDCRGHSADACQQALRQNLEYGLIAAQADGLTLMLEPLNRSDAPGYPYYLPGQVIPLLREFDTPHLRLQFDFYHCAKEGLDLRAEVGFAEGWIGHAQIAGAPDRHEPDLARNGLLDAVRALTEAGYQGPLGAEYRPRATPAVGLAWCEPLRAQGLLA